MPFEKDNIIKLYNLLNKYNLNDDEKHEFINIIYQILVHDEFQRRMTTEFIHHGTSITLGEHIIKDAIMTYLFVKNSKEKYLNLRLAVTIAMLHDLYTVPWQNKEKNNKRFCNYHGFTHPIEAVINAYNWSPDLFKNMNDARIIIDGIIHHMYPIPVRVIKDFNDNSLELYNYCLIKSIPDEYLDILKSSTRRNVIFNMSFSRSIYEEGRIMSYADKLVSRKEISDISSAIALLNGKNKSLKKQI